MSRIYENLFSKIDFESYNDVEARELSENCLFLKSCCCEISSFASNYNYDDIPANGYFSLLAVVVNFDKILNDEISKRRPKFKKYATISRCLKLMFEILLEFKEKMDKQETADKKCLLASDYNIAFQGFIYTLKKPKELSVLFGTVGPFWLYKSMQKIVRQLNVAVTLFDTFPKSIFYVRSKTSRSKRYAKAAVTGKMFKLLDVSDSKMHSLYTNMQYWRSPVKSVTKYVDVETKFEVCHENCSVKQSKGTHRIRFRYLFNSEKIDERKDLLLHIHGGCFVKFKPDAHEIYLKDWALKLSNTPIVAIDYSRTKFHAGLQDVVDLYLWLTTNINVQSVLGFKPNRIVISGDSAGANLAVALTLVLNDICKAYTPADIVFPAGIVGIYGVFKVLPVMSPSRFLFGIDPLLYQSVVLSTLYYYSGENENEIIDKQKRKKTEEKHWFQREDEKIKEVFANITDVLKHPYASPLLYSSFNEMPDIPLALIACHFCPLLDDSVELSKIWKGSVELHVVDGLPHGFLNFLLISKEAMVSSDKCVQLVQQLLCNNNQC